MLLSQVDPRILRATGQNIPGPLAHKFSDFLLRLVSKQDPLPDNAPDGLQKLIRKIYPNGYSIETLGTHVEKSSTPTTQAVADEALARD